MTKTRKCGICSKDVPELICITQEWNACPLAIPCTAPTCAAWPGIEDDDDRDDDQEETVKPLAPAGVAG